MTDVPAIFQQKAVDLGDLKALMDMHQAQAEETALTREQEQIIAWDHAMTRTFKGIVPRSTRVIFMRAAVKAAEANA